MKTVFASILACIALSGSAFAADQAKPNVLFISVDDLNDWIGCLGGHPQTKTPNFDRLAKRGTLFTNAHCAAPQCNPSRTAIFTGLPPYRSGVYHNGQKMRDVLPNAELIPKFFSRHGYWSAGSGKLLHYFIDAASWDDYFPAKEKEDPFPPTFDPPNRPISLPVGGPWQYVETDWAALEVSDEVCGGDWSVTKWIGEQLQRPHHKPFFLACGIYRPHEPWFVPKEYFKPFPLESIQPGPGYKEDDLEDIPPSGQKMGPNRYFEHIRKHGQWKQAIQAYLASIHYADAMLGRVLDALESSPHRGNTIVVLWSDHGWHLGEKQHWQKYTGWRICTRVPLIIRAPGRKAGAVCDQPVSLTDLFHTVTDLCGLPAPENISANSLVPLLQNPDAPWPHAAVTQLSVPEEYAINARHWRYIHYRNGDEELYDIVSDPHEWTNLAAKPEHAAKLAELRTLAPKNPVPVPQVPIASLPALKWHPASEPVPPSKPDGNTFDVVFINERTQPVELCWMTPTGEPKSYGEIESNKQKRQSTRPGAVWIVRDSSQKALGHFQISDRSSKAIIPAP
ncbi:sulfatase-like hydrolase/transferase [Prosthecobacter sp.]|uniref:sulfatase-like hydrolase/transferase n=1 Tax=Prosthecobacter sp. TaxID=1965333 RepID=UPI001D823C14|nr:sulfatase-like hydrolase/transferase [Prosthecobacter sp.]MCB1275096.1 sulfatase-like hydrolase/transferase [Prosthecobacter sp.]